MINHQYYPEDITIMGSYNLESSEEKKDKLFKTNFYNPFIIKHRKKTSESQFKLLESMYQQNTKPSLHIRKCLSEQLEMSPRAVQVWFQNRRAKDKLKTNPNENLDSSSSLIINNNNNKNNHNLMINPYNNPMISPLNSSLPPTPLNNTFFHDNHQSLDLNAFYNNGLYFNQSMPPTPITPNLNETFTFNNGFNY